MRSMSKNWLYRNSWFLTPLAPTLVVAAILVASLLGAASADGSPSAAESAADLPKLAPHQGGQLPPGTAPARASRGLGGVLAGMTSQGLPSFVTVSGDGRRITKAMIAVRLRCTGGVSIVLTDPWLAVRIARGGAFSERFNDSFVQGGVRFRISDRFSGAFNGPRTKVRSTSRLWLTARYRDGSTERCDSGTVRLRATD